MSKSKEASDKDRVEKAIRSLYELFPEFSGCRGVRTRECIDLQKKIEKRKEELDNDAKLKSLEVALKEERKKVAAFSNAKHRQVDALLRRLNLRGVTEELIRDTEKLSNEKPVSCFGDCE